MIKFFMRKITYRGFDKKLQDILFELDKQLIIKFYCSVLFFTSTLLIYATIAFFLNTQMQLYTLEVLLYILGLFIVMFKFPHIVFKLPMLIAERIFFLMYTVKGKAISKKDFQIIKQVDEIAYSIISRQKCRGICYAVCFNICKDLKKGAIQFLAIKDFVAKEGEEPYVIHVLYINNGWAFDTFSSRQYPIDKIHEMYQAIVYKNFSFYDIKDKSFIQFREEFRPEISKWCSQNDCSAFTRSSF